MKMKQLIDIAKKLEKTMRCNCDLDNWQPDQRTNHSWVCRIHRAAMAEWEWEWQKTLKNGSPADRVEEK